MREVYYRVNSLADVPSWGAMVQIWWENDLPMAYASTAEGQDASMPDDPDLTLFRAGLLRAQRDLLSIFVWIEDETLWHEEWGDLVR